MVAAAIIGQIPTLVALELFQKAIRPARRRRRKVKKKKMKRRKR